MGGQPFAEFYQDGGFWMHFIALSAVLGAGVTIERFIFLFFRFNINGAQFFNQIQKLVMANNIDRAIKLCNAADKAALARVIKAGLTRANKSEAEIAAAMEEALLEVSPAISKRLSMMPAIANIATRPTERRITENLTCHRYRCRYASSMPSGASLARSRSASRCAAVVW